MTSKLTRERLQEIAEDGFLKHGESKELARMALAEKASEPVILYRERNPYNGLTTGWQELTENEFSFLKENAGENAEFLTLYRHAQPAPVVPEEKPIPNTLSMYAVDAVAAIAEVKGWNACRAAMLAATPQSPGSEPATVPGKWIPVSERLPEDSGRYWCYVEEQNDLGKSHYQWNCSWNGDRWWVECEGGGIVTHWMPLPAAPQEVNRE
ncbi:hypothetical protein WP2W18E06_27110 [Klebsiella pneumoniae]|uniref:DUF551 domain-containing protein n=1 Tax=Klebsiella pneumoniae TaxID=573 RepID=UPI0015DBCE4D|nr:DUF551 domain-containing protein [Klebsiella pneumoniae]BBQ35589.1 hypothetical protein WP2W18E06_27110 [Klebsiella pneumoniae]